jgi:putative tryptophan/tyrosine transport system permease protein
MSAADLVLVAAFQEGLLYACLGLGVWVSFRVLAFPDLSVDGVFPLGAATAAVLVVHGENPLVATVGSILAGLAAGLVTALLNTKLGINDLLSGILTTTGLYSVNLLIMQGSNVSLLGHVTLFEAAAGTLRMTDHYLVSLIVPGIAVLIVTVLLVAFMQTEFGLALRATGYNEQMARSLGVNTNRTKWVGLALGNGLVALAGALVAQSHGFADVGMGIGSIVIGLAAIILGEGLVRARGVGWSVSAIVLGTIVYRTIIGLSLRLGLGATNLKLVTAVLVILVLSVPVLRAYVMTRRGCWVRG